jgi:hypothetical protein
MNKRQISVRDYRFADTELTRLAIGIQIAAERDQEQFAARGIDAARIAALSTMLADFSKIPQDVELRGRKALAVDAKDALLEQVRVYMRTLRTMAANCWGTKSVYYTSFGFANINKAGLAKLLFMGRFMAGEAGRYMGQLSAFGLTEAMLQQFSQAVESLPGALNAVNDAEKYRILATERRVVAGNTMYAEINLIGKTGKDIWASVSRAHYNHYLIHHSAKTKIQASAGN